MNSTNATTDIQQLIRDASETAFLNADYSSSLALRPQFLSNDYRHGEKVLSAIEDELRSCTSFCFSVAFVSQSGVTPLLQTLKELETKGIPGKILTTDYLTFSEPAALRKLATLTNIELRMFPANSDTQHAGFHTKGYLFEHADGSKKAIVGSSNLTGAALSVNKEWNVKVIGTAEGQMIKGIWDEFSQLWRMSTPLADLIDAYETIYTEKQQLLRQQKVVPLAQAKLSPNSMQMRFISGLDEILESGETSALLISATGTGKTYAAAFALRHMNPGRVLFLAHREQLLRKSMKSFRNVIGPDKTFGLLSGNAHNTSADYLFATMQTMSQDTTLAQLARDAFDVVVIDEAHRAGAHSYEKILGHFDAGFYLGMTASPDRPDDFDIYGLFDNNIAYEIRLQGALEENLLCPFHYFGITEMTVNGQLMDDDFDDFSYLTSAERTDRILEQAAYYGHSGEKVRGLVFCRTNKEAAELARQFTNRGVPSLALSGTNSQEERESAISRLEAAEGDRLWSSHLDYLFTVDIFNEGVDIPAANQIIMLRPTQSPIVFVQQLGRGLRKHSQKDYVVILDFIGNYTNNFMIPLALSGDCSYNKDAIRRYVMEGTRVIPGISTVHFDAIARKQIFRSIDNSKVTLKLLKENYLNLRHKLGRAPDLVDFQAHGDIDPLLLVDKKGSYQAFLIQVMGEECVSFSAAELLALQYLSDFVMKGMRPHELLILQSLLDTGRADEQTTAQGLEHWLITFDEPSYQSAARVLALEFSTSAQMKRKYGELELVNAQSSKALVPSEAFEHLLQRQEFHHAVADLIAFGLQRFSQKYAAGYGEKADHGEVSAFGPDASADQASTKYEMVAFSPFALYEKYTRRDVCQLLNWPNDDSSTMYGYRVKHGTCPIFVTYEKDQDISESTKYEDQFIDQRFFSWMTRSNLRLDSKEVVQIRNAAKLGIDVHLFVKKHDNEGSDLYYLGKANPVACRQCTIKNNAGKELPIVNFTLELEHSVPDDLFDYLEN